jgi:hypothetical protein
MRKLASKRSVVGDRSGLVELSPAVGGFLLRNRAEGDGLVDGRCSVAVS